MGNARRESRCFRDRGERRLLVLPLLTPVAVVYTADVFFTPRSGVVATRLGRPRTEAAKVWRASKVLEEVTNNSLVCSRMSSTFSGKGTRTSRSKVTSGCL